MADPLWTERRTYYPAAHSSGPRSARVAYVVIHSTEGVIGVGGAESTGSYFHSAPDPNVGSTQLIVDDDSTQRVLADRTVCWGAPPLNEAGLHVEQSGHSAWTRAEWLAHKPMILRAAFVTAKWCHRYGIPARWLSAEALRNAGPTPSKPQGITNHANVSIAFRDSTHTDPGPNYPYSLFMWHVRNFLKTHPWK